ncbi:hypothetical protein RHGRI_035403 [Rhododendron griersonianum]|uniref:Uncharacterized protein n=1 Tax=Rhododendron griersonianum TaxID=479676 RepID=A0AAV6IAE3_9ERIC|nr:hypothetical protein RHGRI_035403 [Rhododendron griersonianum]
MTIVASEIVAYMIDRGTGYRIYNASPLFLEKYSDMLPTWDVHEWFYLLVIMAFLGRCDDSIWVLLKSGSHVWPVRIVDNVFANGWPKFVREHAWSPKLTIVFGSERKWIFEVFVLDENHEQIVYPWTITGRALHNWHLTPG